jgi:hypothetical protein
MTGDRGVGEQVSRRTALALGATSLTGGCLDRLGSSTTTTRTRTPVTSAAVFRDLSFEGDSMVVQLPSDHGVDRLHLDKVAGERFTQITVDGGVTSAKLQLLDTNSASTYTRGTYDLVAELGDRTVRKRLELRPFVEIQEIRPVIDGPDEPNRGKLLLRLTNTGSGPTWVYNVAFREAPGRDAPTVRSEVTRTDFDRPTSFEDQVVTPGADVPFQKPQGILVFDETGSVDCVDDATRFEVVVQTSHRNHFASYRATLRGGSQALSDPAGTITCNDVTVTPLRDGV